MEYPVIKKGYPVIYLEQTENSGWDSIPTREELLDYKRLDPNEHSEYAKNVRRVARYLEEGWDISSLTLLIKMV